MAEEKKALPKKLEKIVEEIKALSLIEVADLVKELEDVFGVSAAAPVMMGGAMPQATEAVEEQTEFDVILKESGSNKISAIKAIRVIKPELGLGEAKTFVESAPKTVVEGAKKEDAEKMKKDLEAAGCVAEMK
jgi:large subunit ribosomal protein L7/L12